MKYTVILSLAAVLLLSASLHESGAAPEERRRNLRGQQSKVFIPISQPNEVEDIVEAKEEESSEEQSAWEKEEAYLESLGIKGEEEEEDPESTWEKEEAYIESLEKENAKDSAVEVEEVEVESVEKGDMLELKEETP